jgi:hypothetical protein
VPYLVQQVPTAILWISSRAPARTSGSITMWQDEVPANRVFTTAGFNHQAYVTRTYVAYVRCKVVVVSQRLATLARTHILSTVQPCHSYNDCWPLAQRMT